MSGTDVRIIIDTFIAIMLTEAVVKPIALRTGRGILRWLADSEVVPAGWVPDWLQ